MRKQRKAYKIRSLVDGSEERVHLERLKRSWTARDDTAKVSLILLSEKLTRFLPPRFVTDSVTESDKENVDALTGMSSVMELDEGIVDALTGLHELREGMMAVV